MNRETLQCVASSPRGLADLLARELSELGAHEVRERSTGVSFTAGLEVAYRACLESRIANRVLLVLAEREAADAEGFYTFAREIDWSAHIGPDATLACDFTGKHPTIVHSHFGALKLKDAIVDSLRGPSGKRPDVSRERPGVRVHAHARGTRITLAIDLSGESLHRRGYRTAGGPAPLKENVAAGILLRAGWPQLAARGAQFLDPLCGSGTFVIEAASIAANLAPGRLREYFGFLGWKQHDPDLWLRVRSEAEARAQPARAAELVLRGTDRDAVAVRIARENAKRAGVGNIVTFEPCELADATPAAGTEQGGLLAANPPYGVRLEDRDSARRIHRDLGQLLRDRFVGWDAAILTGAPQLGMELGIRAYRTHVLWNGALECRLLRLKIEPASFMQRGAPGVPQFDPLLRESAGSKMFGNRLAKNRKRIQRWAIAAGVSCYRLYDADMPEYSFAIDSYRTLGDGSVWLYVQEYAAPADVDTQSVKRRRGEALAAMPEVTGVPVERIRLRMRRRQKGAEQYRKVGDRARFHVVEEGGLKLQVNFDDYLDTGLFLDHRLTRARLRDAARGVRFLNLFAYTGTATVYAAAGGALSSTSVDLSRTYLDWARRNLALNGLQGSQHSFVQADCREWLAAAVQQGEHYDLIFLDPPTFSNSKRMQGVLDVRADHVALIDACARVLAPDGLLVFSTNAQRFKLDADLGTRYAVANISEATLPPDFERNPHIHRCFELRRA